MRILILGPYPVVRFRHGGQLRALEIVKAYRRAGHEVLYSGTYMPNPADPDDHTPDDHPVTAAVLEHAQTFRSGFMAMWRALSTEPTSLALFTEQVTAFRPQLVQFEEPYLWPVVQAMKERGYLEGVRIVHSSYNVEGEYRRLMAETLNEPDEETIGEIAKLEAEIAQAVDQVYVVSEADRHAFVSMGAKRVSVISNGAHRRHALPMAVRAVRDDLGSEPFALFVSSGHPLNAQGFLHLVATAQGAKLEPGNLVICGDVANLIVSAPSFNRDEPILARTRLLGRVSDQWLAAVFALAHTIILPKTVGGGSNLKTAEALISSKPVVATSAAFVGYESHTRHPGVVIANSGKDFWSAVHQSLAGTETYFERDQARMAELLWPACLLPMVRNSEALAADAPN